MLEVDFEKCVDSQEEDSRSCPSAGNGVVQDTDCQHMARRCWAGQWDGMHSVRGFEPNQRNWVLYFQP